MTLAELQRQFAGVLMASPDQLTKGHSVRAVDSIVKPNSRLTAIERFEIYRDSYWSRILSCFAEDFPGLRGILGARAFLRLSRAYLLARPSQSFTLRNLGAGLESWLDANRKWAGKRIELALDMVRLEWAHIEAFDGAAVKPIAPEELAGDPANVHLVIQPHLSLLALSYPVDTLRLRLIEIEREGTIHTTLRSKRLAAIRQNQKQEVFWAVHRQGSRVYYRRLERDEFQLLKAFSSGANLEQTLEGSDVDVTRIASWFQIWAQLGWLTRLETEC